MIDVQSYRLNAEHCLRQASSETAPEDKNILLNVALAWLRLAQQTQMMADTEESAADEAAAPTEEEAMA